MKTQNVFEKTRIEDKMEVQTYLSRLKYALKNDRVQINFQKDRKVDDNRNKKFTNRYTIAKLFPEENEIEVIKRELKRLSIEEYIETVKDDRYKNRSDMRVFGRKYVDEDVYIKIRVELINIAQNTGDSFIFVMSFHFAMFEFKKSDFPYRGRRGE